MQVGDLVKSSWPNYDDEIGIVVGTEKYDEYDAPLWRVLWASGELSSEADEDLEVINESR